MEDSNKCSRHKGSKCREIVFLFFNHPQLILSVFLWPVVVYYHQFENIHLQTLFVPCVFLPATFPPHVAYIETQMGTQSLIWCGETHLQVDRSSRQAGRIKCRQVEGFRWLTWGEQRWEGSLSSILELLWTPVTVQLLVMSPSFVAVVYCICLLSQLQHIYMQYIIQCVMYYNVTVTFSSNKDPKLASPISFFFVLITFVWVHTCSSASFLLAHS